MLKKAKVAKKRDKVLEQVQEKRLERDAKKKNASSAGGGDAPTGLSSSSGGGSGQSEDLDRFMTVAEWVREALEGRITIHSFDIFFCLFEKMQWCSPAVLLKTIYTQYEQCVPKRGPNDRHVVQRVLMVLSFWIRHRVKDFRGKKNASVFDMLISFLDRISEEEGMLLGANALKLDIIKAGRLCDGDRDELNVHIIRPRLFSSKLLSKATRMRHKVEGGTSSLLDEGLEDLGKAGAEQMAAVSRYNKELPEELLSQIWLEPVKKKNKEWKKAPPKERSAVGVGYFRKAYSPNPALKGTSPFRGVKLPGRGAVIYQVGRLNVIFKRPLVVVAGQLMLYEWLVFRQVDCVEIMKGAWKRPDAEEVAPHSLWLVNNFNSVSYWAAYVIVFTTDLEARAFVLTCLIELAQECADMNNFNTAMELVAGINSMAVERLKKTWSKVPASAVKSLKQLDKLMSSTNNFENYRTALALCQGKPTLPYMGTYMRDVVYIEDGNPDKPPDGSKMINMKKIRLLADLMYDMNTMQYHRRVPLPPVDFIQRGLPVLFTKMPDNYEDILYDQSLVIEPRK